MKPAQKDNLGYSVTANLKFCLRRICLVINMARDIDKNAYWKASHGYVQDFVCFVPRLPYSSTKMSINHSVYTHVKNNATEEIHPYTLLLSWTWKGKKKAKTTSHTYAAFVIFEGTCNTKDLGKN